MLSAVAASALVTPCRAVAQDATARIRLAPQIAVRRMAPPGDRAVLGILMATGSRADTAGVRVEEVDANGPAAKAGLKAGDVITEINGTSLRLSREDAEDLAVGGLAQRRLQRALGTVKPGDEITLLVRSGTTAPRKLAVKTISQAELDRAVAARAPGEPLVMERRAGERQADERGSAERGMVGLTVGAAGNARDTLGLFISSVVTGGPAEKAGIVEGERVAAVNGVDVRVAREDVDDAPAVSARVNRFVREVQQAAPGKTLTLRVYGNGRYRDVAVTAAKASDLPRTGFSISVGDGAMQILTPRAPSAPRAPQPPRVFEFDRDGDIGRLRFDGQEMRIDLDRLRDSIEEMRRGIERGLERGLEGGLRSFDLREVPARGRRVVVIL
ncbi:MAG: PDZ domain-containing protein [Gemmatimonadaceae bacterium]|nr:PDZ domain-containing protein [Gemmatimonadaceae bacterium]